MIPIVFCASLAPWLRLNAAADTSCSLRNQRSTREGGIHRKIHRMDVMISEAEQQADERRQEDEDDRLGPAARDDRGEARLRDRGARVAADQRVRRAGRQPEVPGDQIPDDRAGEAAEDHREGDDVDVDHAGADGLRDRRAERERGDEVEERRPDDRLAGRQHAGRDDRRDGIGGVVKSVDVVEDERDEDQRDDGQQHRANRF